MPALTKSIMCHHCRVKDQNRMKSYNGLAEIQPIDNDFEAMAASELIEAVKSGNPTILGRLDEISGGNLNVNCHDPIDGSTPLYVAASNGNLRACEWLLRYGARADLPTLKSGSLPLHGAAARGHVDCVSLLLRSNPETVDWRTQINGDTALHLAAYRGHTDICRILLAQDASTDVLNSQGLTPVDEARVTSRYDVFQLLLNTQFASYPSRRCLEDPTVRSESEVRQDVGYERTYVIESSVHSQVRPANTSTSIDPLLDSVLPNGYLWGSCQSNRSSDKSSIFKENMNQTSCVSNRQNHTRSEEIPTAQSCIYNQSNHSLPSSPALLASSSCCCSPRRSTVPLAPSFHGKGGIHAASASSPSSSSQCNTGDFKENDTTKSSCRPETGIPRLVDSRMNNLEQYLAKLQTIQKIKDQRIIELEQSNAALTLLLCRPKSNNSSIEFSRTSPVLYFEQSMENDILIPREYSRKLNKSF